MQIDGRIFVDLLQRTSPGAVQLARLVSLAGRVEPELLRAMRLRHLPDIDAGAEADLWFSPLVQASNPLGLILRPEVLNELRQELAKEENRDLLDATWKTLQNMHRYAPPTIRLEEFVTYLSLKGIPQENIDEALMPAVAALFEQRRMGIASWARHVLPRLPEIARSTVAAQILDVQAAVLLKKRFLLGNPKSDAINFIESRQSNYAGHVSIGVRLLELQGRAFWEFSYPPKEKSLSIEALNRDPIIVEMKWNTVFNDKEETMLILLPLNKSVSVLHPGVQITLRTGIAKSYEFKPPERYLFKKIMEQIRANALDYGKQDNKQDPIKNFLEPLELGKFGHLVEWIWESWQFPVWVIGKSSEYQKSKRKKARFAGEIKLQKVAYFMKYYKLNNFLDFAYDAMPFGPYSDELSKAIADLLEDKIINKIKNGNQKLAEYELTPKGMATFQHIDSEMKNRLGDEEKLSIDNILIYLYTKEFNLINDSAKWHYISTIWAPYVDSYLDIDAEYEIGSDVYIDSLLKMIKDPELAPICYKDCYEIDHSNAIKLMGEYVKSSSQLERAIRIKPFEELFIKPWFFEIFKENISFFIKDILPEVVEFNWLEDFYSLGLKINFHYPELDLEEGAFLVKVSFKNEIYSTQSHVFDKSLIEKIISNDSYQRHRFEEDRFIASEKVATLLAKSKVFDVQNQNTQSMNPLADAQKTKDNSLLSFPYEHPFYPFGIIPLDHPSYVARDSDRRLKKLLNDHSFICLHGDFSSGKSSLLIRVKRMLSEDWIVFQLNLDLIQSGRKGALEMSFFAELHDEYGTIQDWFSLSRFLKEHKLAFLIDEIQACIPEDARRFIEKLYVLVEQAPPEHFRVVLTIRTSIDVYIKSIGLANPKYQNCWKIVELNQFNENELIDLLDLFPQHVALSLKENLNTIKRLTLMEPHEIQLLCDGLWKRLRDNNIPIKDINQQVQIYLKKYRTINR